MEDLPRKAGLVPSGGRSIKPSLLSDTSLKVSRIETSQSQPASVNTEDHERRGKEVVEVDEERPWRQRSNSRFTSMSEVQDGRFQKNLLEDDLTFMSPNQKKTSWKLGWIVASAVGVLGSLGGWLYSSRPRDPEFKVELITLDGFNLRFCTDSPLLLAVVDISLTLHVNATNPNVSPIEFYDTIMDIYYHDTLLGQAKVPAGNQEALSAKTMELSCKLDGLELTSHVKNLFHDVAKREMVLHSVVTISGESLMWKWRHPFQVHVDSYIKVDPIFFDVLDQENKAKLEMAPDWHIKGDIKSSG